jgi:hypothetical protein
MQLRKDVTSTVITAVVILLSFVSLAQAQDTLHGAFTWARDPALARHDLTKIQRVLIVADSDVTVASQFCEDVLAVELMASRISVVSREKRDREQLLKLVEFQERTDEQSQSSRDSAPKSAIRKVSHSLADLVAVGEVTKADALIVVTLVADTAQQNFYNGDPVRVVEVRDDLSVRASSVTVVEVGTGRLLLAGFVGYPNGTPLLKAARDIGQGLIKQLR